MDGRVDYYGKQLEQVNLLCEEGQVPEAAELCRKLMVEAKEEGDQGFELFFRAELIALSGDMRRAARLQEKAAALLHGISYVQGNCAVLLSMAGKPRKAVEYLDQVLRLEKNNLQALGQKGVSLSKMGYDDLALECFERILEFEPGQRHALRNKAVSLSRLGREEESLELFDRVLREDPEDKHARSERAILVDEMNLRGTPLGWLILWFRKRLAPALLRSRYRLAPAEQPG